MPFRRRGVIADGSTRIGSAISGPLAAELDEVVTELESLSELRERPAGTLRVNCGEHPANTLLWPKLSRFLADYPDIKFELFVDDSLADIVAGGFDAGVRLGEQVSMGMIAARIGPDLRMAVWEPHRILQPARPPNRPMT